MIELRRPTRSNPKHATKWSSTLRTCVILVIGKKTVDDITPSDALGVLEPIWIAKPETASRVRQRMEPETASRVRQRMETVMDWAVSHGWLPA